ncbi:unnamed protein product [Rhodiola kirilowii]
MKPIRKIPLQQPMFVYLVLIAGLLAGVLIGALITFLTCTSSTAATTSFLGSIRPDSTTTTGSSPPATPTQLTAILHYATSSIIPQQSLAEIRVTFDVLMSLSPCNFLVFGLGHDSLMWTALNPRGTTIFLEEDPRWVHSVLRVAPILQVHTVKYPTRQSDADLLLASYKRERHCTIPNIKLKGNTKCRLALPDLPDKVYDKEWDLIMIDAPRGYFPEAPGRMGAIFSAAVMARARTKPGVTHVFLHDVNRRVEKIYANEFLCKKYLVKSVGRLWHFEIPPASGNSSGSSFC